jgi:PAS domain S-box-containing protein
VDSALDAIVTMNAAGEVTGWSGHAERLFGWTAAEANGQRLAELIIPPQHRDAHAQGLARFLETGVGRIARERISITALDKSGRELAVELIVTPYRHNGAWNFTGFIRDMSEVRRTERQLAQRERHLRAIIETEPECVKLLDREGRLVDMNASGLAMIEADSLAAVVGESVLSLVVPSDRAAFLALCRSVSSGTPGSLEFNIVGLKGTPRRLETRAVPLVPEDAETPLLLGITRDVTARRQLEERLRTAQRLESVGRLAGGVAHDFNNLLTAILGSAHAIDESLGPDHPRREDVEEIRGAALRAADLTRQLLAFSRQQVLRPRVLDLNALVTRMEKLLRRLIGEHITLRTSLAPALASVRADPGQLEQVIVNLVVNARDAMPAGGTITIETSRADRFDHGELSVRTAAQYLTLSIRDDGPGIDPSVRDHLFEPFFTTKDRERGAGLGLATVYGIVNQSDGHIRVESDLGRGSAFVIYLPAVALPADALTAPAIGSVAAGGNETILVAEDEGALLNLARITLTKKGYAVLTANSGTAALEVATKVADPIHVLLTDVVMPGMSGRDLARRLTLDRPDLQVIFMSGYAGDAVFEMGVLDAGVEFLQKPFTPGELASKVREVLDRRGT